MYKDYSQYQLTTNKSLFRAPNTKTPKKFLFKYKAPHTKFITPRNINEANITQNYNAPDWESYEKTRPNYELKFV